MNADNNLFSSVISVVIMAVNLLIYCDVFYLCQMQIQFELTGHKGAFYIEQDGKRLALMTITMTGSGIMIIDHTEVDDALRGTGAGKKLVAEAVDYARKNNLKIMPLCPFAKSVFDRTPEYADVLN